VMTLPICLPSLRRLVAGSGIARWTRLPILLALVNALLMAGIHPKRGEDYYYLKTNLHPLLLLASAGSVAVAVVAAALVQRRVGSGRRAHVSALALFVGIAFASATLSYGFRAYWPSLRERAVGRPPYLTLQPVADAQAWLRIMRVLDQHKARFGGYLTSYYPTFMFMNEMLDYPNTNIAFYWGAPPDESSGHCVFWEGGPSQQWLEDGFPQRWRCDALARDRAHACVSYHPSWNPQGMRTLCWVCR
jgi:hypothetical protein